MNTDKKAAVDEALRTRDFSQLRELLKSWRPRYIADAICSLSPEDRAVVFRILPRSWAAAAFDYLDLAEQERLLKAMGKEEVAELLNAMPPDDRTALLEELPAAATKQLLEMLSVEERAIAVQLLGYPERSGGDL